MGTPRIITDELGAVKARRDFMPFGEELLAGVGGRTADSGQKYSATKDEVRQKFTGYQKDTETQLDFAEARMYNNAHGRFTAVDPLLASGNSANPQTFNRYVYVGNNPIVITDPSGLDWYSSMNGGKTNYQWYDKDPGKDWDKVDFGNENYYKVPDATDNRTAVGNVYLSRFADNYLTQGEFDRAGRVGANLASFFSSYGNDPKELALRNENVQNAAADVIGGISGAGYNTGAGTYNLGAGTVNYFGGNASYAPEYTPPTPGQSLFYYGTNAAMVAEGGVNLFRGVRSGINTFRAFQSGGTTFGERLFVSETFGITSAKFGNTSTGVGGSWNKAGSFLKAGWSTAKNGGGMEFRVGLLPSKTNANIARFHGFVPKSFVPYSYTGPAIQLKQSLLGLERATPMFPLQF